MSIIAVLKMNISTGVRYFGIVSFYYIIFYNFRESFIFGGFLSKFFYVLDEVFSFICFYSAFLLLFARSFQKSKELSHFLTPGSQPHNTNNSSFAHVLYSIFRVSLNIVDTPLNETSFVMMIIHVCFFLTVPCLLFNFMIGVISARLSAISELEEELSLLFRAQIALFMDLSFGTSCCQWCKPRKHLEVQVELALSDLNLRETFDRAKAAERAEHPCMRRSMALG